MFDKFVITIFSIIIGLCLIAAALYIAFTVQMYISRQYTQPKICYETTENYDQFQSCLYQHLFTIKWG